MDTADALSTGGVVAVVAELEGRSGVSESTPGIRCKDVELSTRTGGLEAVVAPYGRP